MTRLSLLLVIAVTGCAVGGAKKSASQPYVQSRLTTELPATNPDSRVEAIAADAPQGESLGGRIGPLFAGPAGPPVAAPLTPAVPKDNEKLVIEAWIELRVDEVSKAAADIRARVEADGGRVVSENIIGPDKAATSAAMELRVPPGKTAAFQTWLAAQGLIESRRVLASDVSKTLFDQQLALDNLELTMKRLQELAKRDIAMKELLELEKEMTRVRGDIERIKGEQRWLMDRVELATISLTLTREGGPVEFAPHARIHPGAHLATLSLLDPGDRPRTRVGGGVTVHIQRFLTFDLDVFPRKQGDSRVVIGTVGTALYSSFLGAGRREFLNPYLGFRAGYGYLSGEQAGLVGGELGLELYKQRYVQIEIAGRALAFFRDDSTDVALHVQLGLEVPF
ncbi:MAG TPA: DUF4349 domain-containing protein [Kofleriaceae bacterium]|nr:DUF4349 domain-containing protein [Kofleriaceae bacterium]